MRGRFIQIVGMTEQGYPEIEEEFEVIDTTPIYAFGSQLPVHYARTPGVERHRRIVTDPVEIAELRSRGAIGA